MVLTVRPALPADAAAIAALVAQYWKLEGIDGFDPGRVAGLLRDAIADSRQAVCWLAEQDGVAVGYLLAVWVFSLEHGGRMAEVDELFVAPAARGGGVGTQLLGAAEQALRQAGAVRLQLQRGIVNGVAAGFYRRHGYAPRADYELWDKPLAAG